MTIASSQNLSHMVKTILTNNTRGVVSDFKNKSGVPYCKCRVQINQKFVNH